MKIAIVNVTFQYGSTGQLAFNLYKKAIENGNEAKIFYGRDPEINHDSNIIKIEKQSSVIFHAFMTRMSGLEGYFSYFSTKHMLKALDKFRPDVVVLFNLVGYYIHEPLLFRYLNKNNVKTIYCMIDEYSYCGKCCYPNDCQNFMEKCVQCPLKSEYPESWIFDVAHKKQQMKYQMYGCRYNYIFAGPEYVCERAKKSKILGKAKLAVLDECIDTNIYKIYDTVALRMKYGIPKRNKVVLNVCPVSNKRKGAEFYFEAIKRISKKDITYIHVGCDTDEVKYPDNMIKVGYIYNQQELAEYMSLADVFVCSSMNDTMPNTCLEALACGTPVIGFQAAGIPFVADHICGTFVEAGNVSFFAEAIDFAPRKDDNMMQYCRDYALKRYSFDAYYNKILEIQGEFI